MIQSFIRQIGDVPYKCDERLAPYTTFNIGGPADVIAFPRTPQELAAVLRAAHETKLAPFFLGGGSNLLISDEGIRGVVVQLSGEMEKLSVSDDGKEIMVGTAITFPKLTKVALDLGWTDALGWHGTPGLVGGALKMNAGGRLGELGTVVQTVYGVSLEGELEFSHSDAGFSYRNSKFPSNAVLTFAKLRFENADRALGKELSLKAKELVIRRKQTQPKHRSAGSMFKNPPNDYAGRLIEAAGLKGSRIGDAQISMVHANFIVNLGSATAQDVFALSKLARETVLAQSGVLLEYEVKLIGLG
jgi:UDP-N-acetylmuramate dehydrogenase